MRTEVAGSTSLPGAADDITHDSTSRQHDKEKPVANSVRLQRRMRSAWKLIRRHPWVFIVPLICLATLLTAGIVGVTAIADTIAKQRQDDARSEASVRGIVIVEQLSRAMLPSSGLLNTVLETPDYHWPTIEADFNHTARYLFSLLASSGFERHMVVQLAPAGVVRASYPLAGNEAAIGHNVLSDTAQRDNIMKAIRTQQLYLAGPYRLKQGYVGAPVRVPIFVNASYGRNETFDMPIIAGTNSSLPYDCDLCFEGRRFWGFVSTVLNWEAIRMTANLDTIALSGYEFRLTRPPQGTETEDYILAESPSIVNQTMIDPLALQFKALTSTWTIRVSRLGGWYPNWYSPLIAVVVIVAVALSVLLGLVLGWNRRLMDTTAQLTITSDKLSKEKLRLDALIIRQMELIRCFAGSNKTPGASLDPLVHASSALGSTSQPEDNDHASGEDIIGSKIAAMRSNLKHLPSARLAEGERIQLLELLGAGNFGKVYKGLWHGTTVAVKCLVLPSSMSRSTRAETMAVMEAAISSALNHPHLVQTFTYSIRPIRDTSMAEISTGCVVVSEMGTQGGYQGLHGSSANHSASAQANDSQGAGLNDSSTDVHSFEVRLVLEYCDGGSLRDALDSDAFFGATALNYGAMLETAADIAKGMLHLHANEVLHSDLKACNIMFKSDANARGFTAKVADFGLAIQLDQSKNQTHVSRVFQGTLTHMAPEALLQGKISKAADVYSFGILLYELYTGAEPYSGIATALLGHHVAGMGKRPSFPIGTPSRYRELAERCWQVNPEKRPTFAEILEELCDMCDHAPSTQPLVYSREAAVKQRLPQLQKSFTADRPQQHTLSGSGIEVAVMPSAAAVVDVMGGDGDEHELEPATPLVLTSLRQTLRQMSNALMAIPEAEDEHEAQPVRFDELATNMAEPAELAADDLDRFFLTDR